MIHITGIRLTNFSRFRGTFELELEPKAYAVIAQHDEDERRSNWLGKTALVSAIRYALYGKLPKAYETLDSAISYGEETMVVDLELSDGTFISRERKRGSWTAIRCVARDGANEVEFEQDAAQRFIEGKVVGLELDDYDDCAQVAQKQTDRFVRREGEELLNDVRNWADLAAIERTEENCSLGLKQLVREAETLCLQLERLAWANEEEGKKRQAEIARLKADYKSRAKAYEAELKASQNYQQWVERFLQCKRARELDEQIEKGDKSFDPKLESAVDAAFKTLQAKREEQAEAACQHKVALSTARSEFDGKCPVLSGFQCPAKVDINASRAPASNALKAAEKALSAARQKADTEQRVWASAKAELDEQGTRQRVLQQFVVERERLQVAVDYIEKHGEPGFHPAVHVFDAGELQRAELVLEEFQNASSQRISLAGSIEKLETRIRARRAALIVLEEAQKQLAEGTVLRVEAGANRRLEKANIELQAEFRWGRETNKLATRCGHCGAEFPSSARVKQCQVCGAVRGIRIEPKPHLKLSNRSGAAEDLVGIAFTLSAREIIQEQNESNWGVVVLDEPFAHTDEYNRKALSGHLFALVSDGIEQSFVVAHTRDVLDSLPGRIEITGHGDWSKIRVVA